MWNKILKIQAKIKTGILMSEKFIAILSIWFYQFTYILVAFQYLKYVVYKSHTQVNYIKFVQKLLEKRSAFRIN